MVSATDCSGRGHLGTVYREEGDSAGMFKYDGKLVTMSFLLESFGFVRTLQASVNKDITAPVEEQDVQENHPTHPTHRSSAVTKSVPTTAFGSNRAPRPSIAVMDTSSPPKFHDAYGVALKDSLDTT